MKYKVERPRIQQVPFGKPSVQKQDEFLSGYINGMKATDIEERFARALNKDKRIDGFIFRMPIMSPRHMAGQIELDFLAQSGPHYYPVQIDGAYAHKNIGKQQDDAKKDILINEYLRKTYNALPIIRIKGIDLETQEEADIQERELIR